MPRKPEPVAAPAVIKWTEEEWELIAKRLLEVKGPELLQSAQLDEVKAKDVFLAQDSLLEERHRKLISISQGFQAIRQRLHGIMQKVGNTAQDDLFTGSEQTGVNADAPPAATVLDEPQRKVRKSAKQVRPTNTESRASATPESAKKSNDGESSSIPLHAEEQPSSAPPPSAGEQPEPSAGEQPVQRHVDNARQPASRRSRVNEPRPRAQEVQAPLPVATGDFIEMVRPFVSMFCQELATALVNKLMEQGGSQAMSSLLQGALSGVGQSSPREQSRRYEQHGKAAYPDEPGMAASFPPVSSHAHDDEDGDHAETDVQPLFDPKLPPSANSAFKPMIALIGTSPRDFEDLQQYYPQLELKVVSLEDLRTAPSLRSCQRMMGLREDIPAPADEFLRKTFKNRYLRVIGGINQVREQLNTWLANPATINEQPRWPRKQGNSNGKGQGAGFPKKRQFRRPKPAP